eukprot:jgi/Mesvir1/21312/Mv15932-RA.1
MLYGSTIYLCFLGVLLASGRGSAVPLRIDEELPRLHDNPSAACSGCQVVVSHLAAALSSPSPLLREETVPAIDASTGEEVRVPYVRSRRYVSDLLAMVCTSTMLARYTRTESWLGRIDFIVDPIPDFNSFSDHHNVDPLLRHVCRGLTQQSSYRSWLESYAANVTAQLGVEGTTVVVCGRVFRACMPQETTADTVRATLALLCIHDPARLLALLPLLVAGALLAYVTLLFAFPAHHPAFAVSRAEERVRAASRRAEEVLRVASSRARHKRHKKGMGARNRACSQSSPDLDLIMKPMMGGGAVKKES